MKIRLRNVGRINSLDFELKPGLTLLCGPNSTGKTYAAYVLYSVLTHLGEIPAKWFTEEDIANLIREGSFALDLRKIIASEEFLQDISEKLARHLPGDFDAPKDFFGKNSISIETLLPPDGPKLTGLNWPAEITDKGILITFALSADTLTLSLTNLPGKADLPLPSAVSLTSFLNIYVSTLFSAQYFGHVQVLSAERAAINLFSRELSASRTKLVDQLLAIDESGDREKDFNLSQFIGQKAARYSLPIRKGLEVAEDLKNISKYKSDFAAFADNLENSVLGGKIQIGEYGELIYRHDDMTSLRINLAASMVKSLASLVVYLRHQANKGDLLIIDEPELNLHPDSQRKIARFLCELSNAGLNILISTHSDYIVREVNNAILLKHPGMQNVKAKYGYRDDQLLAPERVSVVLFNAAGNPKQLPIDHKGFAVDSIDDEINLLNQIAQDIEQEWQE